MLPTFALASFALAVIPAKAAAMSASSTAPAIDGADIANYGDVTGHEKWFADTGVEGPAQGRSFTTGGVAVPLKAITYQVSEGAAEQPANTYALRSGSMAVL